MIRLLYYYIDELCGKGETPTDKYKKKTLAIENNWVEIQQIKVFQKRKTFNKVCTL
jgi:hypothetical protein